MKDGFRLPKGARFDLSSGTWSTGPDRSTTVRPSPKSNRANADAITLGGTIYLDKNITMQGHSTTLAVGDFPAFFLHGSGYRKVNNVTIRSPGERGFTVNLPKVDFQGVRGLLIGPPTAISGRNVEITPTLPPEELRFSMLFWDHLIVPTSSLLAFDLGPEVGVLREEGLLSSAEVKLQGEWTVSEIAAATNREALRAMLQRYPDRWSSARREGEIRPFADEGERAVLQFDLHSVIPVPDKDVPMDEVLAFRLKRVAELQALRTHIDDVVTSVMLSPDRGIEQSVEIERLEQSIADYLRVSKERAWNTLYAGLRAKISCDSSVTYSKLTSAYGMGQGVMVATGNAMLAGLASVAQYGIASLKFDPTKKAVPPSLNAFEYVFRYHKDLFVKPVGA